MSDHQHDHGPPEPAWKHDGVRVIKGNQLDTNTPQTPGMNRAAAINAARVGAQKIWAGTVSIAANAKTGAHHHGLVVAAYQHALQRLVGAGVDLLMRHVGRHEDEVAGAGLGHEL